MSTIITRIMILITVILSIFSPGNVDKAAITIDKPVTTENSIIEYTYTNNTGYVIDGYCKVEKLELKVLDTWVEVPVYDEAPEADLAMYPGQSASRTYNAVALIPGTYRLTICYEAVVGINGETNTGHSSVEFTVSYR